MRPLKKARRCEHWAAGLGSAGLAEAIMASIGVEWVGSCLQFDLLVNFIEEWRYLIECNPDLPRTACVKPMWHWSPESNHASIVENGLIEGGSEGVPVRNGSAHGKGVYGSPDICAARDYGEGTDHALGCVVLLGRDSVRTRWGKSPIYCVKKGRGPRVLVVGRTSGQSAEEIREVQDRMETICALFEPCVDETDRMLEACMVAHTFDDPVRR